MTRVAAPQLRTCRPQLAAVIAWPGRLVESRSQRVRTLVLINGRPRAGPRPICSTVEHGAPGVGVALVWPATYWVALIWTWPASRPRQAAAGDARWCIAC